MSHSEANILADAACARYPRNTVFITLKNPVAVAFTHGSGNREYAKIRTFGAQFDPRLRGRTSLYIPGSAFPKVPPPPGTVYKPHRGPVMYGGFGYRGDLLDLAAGECPVS